MIRNLAPTMRRIDPEWLRYALQVAGAASVAFGIGMIYEPAALIVGGIAAILIAEGRGK